MNLKISLFNKSIIKSDFKRYWWVSALNTLTIFIMFTFPYIYYIIEFHRKTRSEKYIFSPIYNDSIPSTVFSFMYTVLLCILLFSYLNSSKACACLHGLPIKRKTFFCSHILSGAVLTIVPLLINLAVFMIFRMDATIAESFFIRHLLVYSGLTLLYSFVGFAFATLVMMIAGNSIAAIVFTGIFAALPMCVEEFVHFFCSQNVYGYDVSSSKISEFIYVVPSQMCASPINVLKYIIIIAVFLTAAYALYRIRKLENNGEIVAFPKLRYVFVFGVAICAGAVGYLYLSWLLDNKNILLLIPFGILGIIIAEMIVKKRLRITKAYKPVILFCVAVIIVKLAVAVDLTGYEKRIPKLDDIEKVSVNLIGINDNNYFYNHYGERIYPNTDNDITNPEIISKTVDLHRTLVENRNEEWGYSSDYDKMPLQITYTLRSGKTLVRNYLADFKKQADKLESLLVTKEMRKQFFPILDNTEKKYSYAFVGDQRLNDDININDSETIEKLVAALKADTAKTQYEKYVHRTSEYTQVYLQFKRHGTYENGQDVPEENLPDENEEYYIRDDYTNTIKVLREIGFYDKLPKSSDIEKIEIAELIKGNNTGNSYGHTQMAEVSERSTRTITDAKDIEAIYNYCIKQKVEYRECDMEMGVYFKDGHTMYVNYKKTADSIPECMK